jgi:hypothetical protein
MKVQRPSSWSHAQAHLCDLMAHLCDLKDDLDITDGQSIAWDMFVYTVSAQTVRMLEGWAGSSPHRIAAGALDSPNVHTDKTVRLEALRTVKRATDGLYTVLTPTQRRRADRFLRPVRRIAGPCDDAIWRVS